MNGNVSEARAQTDLYSRAEQAAKAIRARTSAVSRVALVLGSGLGGFADEFADAVALSGDHERAGQGSRWVIA